MNHLNQHGQPHVFLEPCSTYDINHLRSVLARWAPIFRASITKADTVVIKPNWLTHTHKYIKGEWQSVITHPNLITSLLEVVLQCLQGSGSVLIADAPQTNSRWDEIMKIMQPETWIKMGRSAGVDVKVLDLRLDEWVTRGDLIIYREKRPGDPLGSTTCNLRENSEFLNHKPSKRGYFGADYNKEETNMAHSNGNHKYKVSRSILASTVFINVPKLKTHKKAGITCSLKNLVGINTYKNYLPHYNEGTPQDGGDQFPESTTRTKTETILLAQFNSLLSRYPKIAKTLIPLKTLGKALFGHTRNTIRSGSWYGNDTLWRTVLDLNKILLYANPDGTLRPPNQNQHKRYISLVDAIISGEGNGPEAPTPKNSALLILGTNPVSVDCVCAKIMGFDYRRIPSIRNAFLVRRYPICEFSYDHITVHSSDMRFNKRLTQILQTDCFNFQPHFGWKGHIEL